MAITDTGNTEIIRTIPANKPANLRVNIKSEEAPLSETVPKILATGVVSGFTSAGLRHALHRGK